MRKTIAPALAAVLLTAACQQPAERVAAAPTPWS
jgi:hypothetical protein